MPYRRPIDKPLRRDVRWLGELLGQVLLSLEGEPMFELEERIRRLSIARRRGPKSGRREAAVQLLELIHGLPTDQAEPVIRAFAHYFRLVNVAEQHHRIRRARAHAAVRGGPPQRGSLAAILQQARSAGVTAERARQAIAELEVTLTLTAHPTEATRRTVLEKVYGIAQALEERDRSRLTEGERQDLTATVREQIALLWQTDEVRREKPTVGDEVKNVVWYIEEVLWDLLPLLARELARAFERAFGEPLRLQRIPIRLHSWVGGDMDGNPFVTPEVLADAILAYRERGLRRLLADVRRLGAALSQSSRYIVPSERLLASIAEDQARMPEVARVLLPRTEGEPWRRKLGFIEHRLGVTVAQVEALREPSGDRADAPRAEEAGASVASADAARTDARSAGTRFSESYVRARDLERDLETVVETLAEAVGRGGGVRQARELLEKVRALGFQIAEIELRAHAGEVRAADSPGDGAGARILAALERVAAAQRGGGERSCRTLILSMTQGAGDILAAFRCAKRASLLDPARSGLTIDIVPLFESLAALEQSPAIVRELFAEPEYRRHVEARGVQEVMIGYSDSGKEVGLLAASAALYKSQQAMSRIARESGVPIRIFHGRGETVARGGGPAQAAILALPKGSVAGRYKATEQGEALDHKYGRPELALRTLELVVGGALLHTLGAEPQAAPYAEARYLEVLDVLAEAGRKAFRALVWDDPRFAEFFLSATPIEEITQMPIGSRPSKRQAGGLEALRAIPWVFAWTQTRAILPAWYGVGTALSEAAKTPATRELLLEMYANWPFFQTIIHNLEMVLAKTDMRIAGRYVALAPAAARDAIWPKVREEHRRTRRWVKHLTGNALLLDKNLALQRSIRLRNPYIDPLNLLQVELVRRKRAGDPDCTRPILLTVNGIAAGMRNTG